LAGGPSELSDEGGEEGGVVRIDEAGGEILEERTAGLACTGREYGASSGATTGIGASIGGPPALQLILTKLEKPFRLPVVICQHIAAGFVQGLVEGEK
jgi:chemotaxis response regulator CheB